MNMQKQETNMKKIEAVRIDSSKEKTQETTASVSQKTVNLEDSTPKSDLQRPLLVQTVQEVESKFTDLVLKHPVAFMSLAVVAGYVGHSLFKKYISKDGI